MSKEDRYYTAPLSILRSGNNPLEALLNVLSCGIVNAGIGYRKVNHEDEFQTLLEEANDQAEEKGAPVKPPPFFNLKGADGKPLPPLEAKDAWFCAHAGSKLLSITGGNRADDARIWAMHRHEGAVFFKIKSEWLWNAIRTARREAGVKVEEDFKPLSWREFRILAAILSSKPNSYQFTFLGWECIQARACGFHSKALFESGRDALPAHCQPLTRQMIRDACDKLEPLGFFAKCRYSGGKSGGFTAYSFRHPKREDLQAAVLQWKSANSSLKAKRDAHHASDLEAFKRTK